MMHLNNEEQSKYANLGEKENNSSKTKAVKRLKMWTYMASYILNVTRL